MADTENTTMADTENKSVTKSESLSMKPVKYEPFDQDIIKKSFDIEMSNIVDDIETSNIVDNKPDYNRSSDLSKKLVSCCMVSCVLLICISLIIVHFFYTPCTNEKNIYYLVNMTAQDDGITVGNYDMHFNRALDDNDDNDNCDNSDIFMTIYLDSVDVLYYEVGQKYLLYKSCNFYKKYSLYGHCVS